MAQKSLALTIIAHQGYIRHTDDDGAYLQQRAAFFSAISDTYLPLLRLFETLERDKVPFRAAMVFSPTLCALFSDPLIQQGYIQWQDKVIALGRSELAKQGETSGLTKTCLSLAEQNRQDFVEKYRCNLLSGFMRFIQSGYIEVLATCATYAFLPHYADMREVWNAQIEVGLRSHKEFFSIAPEGFWLPYLGYAPGIEKALKSYGFSYTILDTHGLLFANPLPEKGVFSPARCENSFAVFARDGAVMEGIPTVEDYMLNPLYRNQNRDLVFEEDLLSGFMGEGSARIPSGYKYWANGKGGGGGYYDPQAARGQAKKDAAGFLAHKKQRLLEGEQVCPDARLSLVYTLNARMLGELWSEGLWWLEELFRLGAKDPDISFVTPESLLENQFSLQKITPYMSAACGNGYGENLLDNTNAWLIRYVRKACGRMIDLTDRFSGERGVRARMLNLAAKEALLSLASDWPKMLHGWRSPDYAERQFKESILAFTTVFDSLGSNTMSTEWLTSCEKMSPLFPWLNYRVFSKKHPITPLN
jgi:1,4-alpha-glucan branching enzyme